MKLDSPLIDQNNYKRLEQNIIQLLDFFTDNIELLDIETSNKDQGKNIVYNRLISNFYERPFQDDLGANLRGFLFEPTGLLTTLNIKDNIKSVIKKYEPRVAITSIKVDNMESDNSYHIAVNFNIKEYDSASGVEIVLRRLR